MISNTITLILGAGASIPFGFPSGRRLLIEICDKLDLVKGKDAPFCETINKCGFAFDFIKEFRSELFNSMQPSVDAFLEKRNEYLEIGKAAIARALIPYERKARLERWQDNLHWYEYLFSKMDAKTPDDFQSNRISFVTFNYDRSLEYFLFQAIKHSYGLNDDATAMVLKTIPIVHVHGQLGHLPYVGTNVLEYNLKSDNLNAEIVKKSAGNILIIHEIDEITEDFKIAHKLIEAANKVVFIGFGYHPTNMKRLIKQKIGGPILASKFFGTAFDLSEGDKITIKETFKDLNSSPIHLGRANEDALLFLRDKGLY
ncbi:MAG TPA: hypothetical protein ACFYEH_06380 [Candidatus Brocadiaceae bacterium]